MKTIECTSFFKKVSQAQADKVVELKDKVGQKRADIKWSFSGLDHKDSNEFVRDLESLKDEHVAYFLNKAIENFGRDLIADSGSDWNFVPSADKLTLAAAFDYYNEESKRERILTKASAAAFAAVYAKLAPAVLEITPAAATAAQAVICDWIKYSKDEKVSAAILSRLTSFAEKLAEADDDSQLSKACSEHIEVLMALIKAFEPKEVKVEISADAL